MPGAGCPILYAVSLRKGWGDHEPQLALFLRSWLPLLQSVARYNFRMAHTYEEVHQIACELPVDQRILLANSLWESIERGEFDASEAEVDAAWDAEIGRRVAEIKTGSAVNCLLEDIAADLRLEGDVPVLRKSIAAPRTGWAEACRNLAAAGGDALALPEFANEADAELTW